MFVGCEVTLSGKMPRLNPRFRYLQKIFVISLALLISTRLSGQALELETPTCSPTCKFNRRFTLPSSVDNSATTLQELFEPFPVQRFVEDFWEKQPMVIRGRSPVHYEKIFSFGVADVETVIKDGVSLSGDEPYLVTGSDWNIIKRVFNPKDGEFWTAALPPSSGTSSEAREANQIEETPSPTFDSVPEGHRERAEPSVRRGRVTLDDARRAFQHGGFSLVINRLQRRWRSLYDVSQALEDALGHPVNANLYMTPPGCQGFEAHFDWMDGIIVQLAGSKTWMLYDETITVPRPDQKFKPSAALLGEPFSVVELRPGDLMYIPRGWAHEAAVNGTSTEGSGVAHELSLHITFGIEASLYGTYESLLHHALEVAAEEHLHGFCQILMESGSKTQRRQEKQEGEGEEEEEEEEEGVGALLPWLELLHLCLHDVASRNEGFRRSVPLTALFHPPRSSSTRLNEVGGAGFDPRSCTGDGSNDDSNHDSQGTLNGGANGDDDPLPEIIALQFNQLLRDLRDGANALSTMGLLDSLSEMGQLRVVAKMFKPASSTDGAEEEHLECDDEGEGGRCKKASTGRSWEEVLDAWDSLPSLVLDRALFASNLGRCVEEFLEVASVEAATERMVLAMIDQAHTRATTSEEDLARCGQESPSV